MSNDTELASRIDALVTDAFNDGKATAFGIVGILSCLSHNWLCYVESGTKRPEPGGDTDANINSK